MEHVSPKARYRILIMMAMASGLVAACSSDGGGAPVSSSAAAIEIEDFSFGESITVASGARVTVTNRDGTGHTWTSATNAFDSGFLNPGDQFEVVLGEAGSFDFFCTVHPSMTGTVVVEG